jgi:hypothetical protein
MSENEFRKTYALLNRNKIVIVLYISSEIYLIILEYKKNNALILSDKIKLMKYSIFYSISNLILIDNPHKGLILYNVYEYMNSNLGYTIYKSYFEELCSSFKINLKP